MAHLPMSQVVYPNEYGVPQVGIASGGVRDAKTYLVSRMYTDAVFNQDIRVIQTIINRIDGGLPKDTEVDEYQTLFGDCMNKVLSLTDGAQLKVFPSDSVMMALCKSLYDIATTDIYHEVRISSDGHKFSRPRRPSTEQKQARDAALRLIHERAGGRKTAIPKRPEQKDNVIVAPWITAALPQGGDEDAAASEA